MKSFDEGRLLAVGRKRTFRQSAKRGLLCAGATDPLVSDHVLAGLSAWGTPGGGGKTYAQEAQEGLLQPRSIHQCLMAEQSGKEGPPSR